MVGSVGRRMPGLNRVNRAYKIVETLKLLKDSVTITLVIVDTAACPRSVCYLSKLVRLVVVLLFEIWLQPLIGLSGSGIIRFPGFFNSVLTPVRVFTTVSILRAKKKTHTHTNKKTKTKHKKLPFSLSSKTNISKIPFRAGIVGLKSASGYESL